MEQKAIQSPTGPTPAASLSRRVRQAAAASSPRNTRSSAASNDSPTNRPDFEDRVLRQFAELYRTHGIRPDHSPIQRRIDALQQEQASTASSQTAAQATPTHSRRSSMPTSPTASVVLGGHPRQLSSLFPSTDLDTAGQERTSSTASGFGSLSVSTGTARPRTVATGRPPIDAAVLRGFAKLYEGVGETRSLMSPVTRTLEERRDNRAAVQALADEQNAASPLDPDSPNFHDKLVSRLAGLYLNGNVTTSPATSPVRRAVAAMRASQQRPLTSPRAPQQAGPSPRTAAIIARAERRPDDGALEMARLRFEGASPRTREQRALDHVYGRPMGTRGLSHAHQVDVSDGEDAI